MNQIIISKNKEKLNIAFIQEFLSNTYWAKGRTIEEMKICVDHSINFGVYIGEQQIGYARVVTDFFQFAYLMDVFMDKDFRGLGYSKQLMSHIFETEELRKIKVWRLATSDAHGLYKQFGFTELAKPQNIMERIS